MPQVTGPGDLISRPGFLAGTHARPGHTASGCRGERPRHLRQAYPQGYMRCCAPVATVSSPGGGKPRSGGRGQRGHDEFGGGRRGILPAGLGWLVRQHRVAAHRPLVRFPGHEPDIHPRDASLCGVLAGHSARSRGAVSKPPCRREGPGSSACYQAAWPASRRPPDPLGQPTSAAPLAALAPLALCRSSGPPGIPWPTGRYGGRPMLTSSRSWPRRHARRCSSGPRPCRARALWQ